MFIYPARKEVYGSLASATSHPISGDTEPNTVVKCKP